MNLKLLYFSGMLSAKKHNMKEAWSVAKQYNLPKYFIINNLATTDKYEIAKGLNYVFANIGKLTSNSVPHVTETYKDYIQKSSTDSIFIEPIYPSNISEIVKNLNQGSVVCMTMYQ